MGWNEAEVLRWLARRPRPARLVGSSGHDAAVLRALTGLPVLCADQVIEGVHVERGCPGRTLGRKAAGRALSDLAATAARPEALVLCIAAPRGERAARLEAVIEGVAAKAREHGAELVGGDLSGTRGALGIAVTALGRLAASDRRPPGRDRARAGQVVLLSGAVGGSRLGRHLEPEPRFDFGQFLWSHGASALMDVSDGLALDLARLARAARVRIDLEQVPIHADARRAARRSRRTPLAHALHDGEDHELLATLDAETWRALARRARRRFPALVVIGRVRSGRGLYAPRTEGGPLQRWDGKGGFVHGA